MTKITWIQVFATVFQLLTSTAGTCDFKTPVGIRNELKAVADDKMTSSTDKDANSTAKFGRLHGTMAWCPDGADADRYLQIDLGQSYVICAVEVQGEPAASVFTTFTLKSSPDNATYVDVDSGKVFTGSAANGNTADFHNLSSTITARYIRFKPGSSSLCLRVEIYGTPENVTVTCKEYEMVVVATSLADATGLSLVDLSCLPSATDASSANFTIPLGQCDTTLTISSDEVKSFYLNKIFRNSTSETLFTIICSYIRAPKVTTDDGSFTFSFGIFENGTFETPVGDSEIALNRRVYFKLEVESLDSDLELHLIKCWTTPTANADDSNGITFLESGCPVTGNINISDYDCTKNDTKQSFSLLAFRFFNQPSGSRVYFHCNVLVCLNSNPSSTCKSQCTACSNSKRKRRDVKADPDEVHLVIGPFTIIDNDKDNNDDVDEDNEDGERDPTLIVEDSESFPVTWLIIICVSASVAMAIIIGLLVAVKLSQSARGPAVKDVTADLARDNLAFDELDIKTLSMKSLEQGIRS